MHPSDAEAVTGDADVIHQALIARRRECLDRSAGREGGLPLVVLHQVVQLDQIDVVDRQAFQRSFEFRPGIVAASLAGLGGEEYVVAMVGQPRPKPVFGRPVRRGRVDVVDPPLVHLGQRHVGAVLAHAAERCRTEDHPGRQVPGRTERQGGE